VDALHSEVAVRLLGGKVLPPDTEQLPSVAGGGLDANQYGALQEGYMLTLRPRAEDHQRSKDVRAIVLAVVGLSLCTASLARAAGSAATGEDLFKHKCGSCHSVETGKNRVGPSLAGVVGRKAASIETYSYSAAMRSSGLTWDTATLDSYLTNPRAKVPGTKMTFVGLPQANGRADIIAYLNTLK
jgi:cytochrome c